MISCYTIWMTSFFTPQDTDQCKQVQETFFEDTKRFKVPTAADKKVTVCTGSVS